MCQQHVDWIDVPQECASDDEAAAGAHTPAEARADDAAGAGMFGHGRASLCSLLSADETLFACVRQHVLMLHLLSCAAAGTAGAPLLYCMQYHMLPACLTQIVRVQLTTSLILMTTKPTSSPPWRWMFVVPQ